MFTINGDLWNVKYVSPYDSSLKHFNSDTYALGCCNNMDKTIYINNTLRGELMKKVLCHEITHAAMFSYGVNITYDQEELVADLLATYGEEVIDITNKIFNKLKEGYY